MPATYMLTDLTGCMLRVRSAVEFEGIPWVLQLFRCSVEHTGAAPC
jgi:hypothetical protein